MARQKSVSGAWYSVPKGVSRGVFFDKIFLSNEQMPIQNHQKSKFYHFSQKSKHKKYMVSKIMMKVMTNSISLLLILLFISCTNDQQDPGKVMETTVSGIEQVTEGYNAINLYTIAMKLIGEYDTNLRMKAGINYNSSMDSLGVFLIATNAITHESKIKHLLSHELKDAADKEAEFSRGALKITIGEKKIRSTEKREAFEYTINIYDLLDDSDSFRTANTQLSNIHLRPYGIQYFETEKPEKSIIRLYNCSESGSKKTNIYSFAMMMYNSETLDETMKLLAEPEVVDNATLANNQDYLEIVKTYTDLEDQKKSSADYKGLPFKDYQ